MAANYFHSLADENQDLQKQIGCMTGVFQILNRHHIVSGRRVVNHSSTKGVHGDLLLNNVTPRRESSGTRQRHVAVEKHRVSTESSRPMKRHNLDLRDVVKDSMHREARGLSHNIVTKEDTNNWYHDEPRELSRSKSCQFRHRIKSSVSKYYPRFSYDGHETDCLSIKTDSKTTNPRLSLDSGERFTRTLSRNPSNHSRNPKTNTGVDADKDLSQTQPSGVVAKLIGMGTFPLSNSLDESGSIVKMANSTKSSLKEPLSPCRKNPDMKPISKIPIEPAPWKQQDGTHEMTSSTKIRGPESGKDLRALKQILGAMQAVEAKHDHQNPPCVNRELDVSMGHECRIVIMKPSKLVKNGCMNNNAGNYSIKTDCRKQIKQSNNLSCYSRDSSSSTPDKTTLSMKLNELLTSEYPSPVSVRYDSFYADNSPSPVKHTPITKKDDDATEKSIKHQYEAANNAKLNTMISEVSNSNDRYISEILLASGLFLRDVRSLNPHPSGHPINPDLFSVLEHTKCSYLQTEKLHRKLIFDAVNEILMEKLSSASEMIMHDPKKILREVCLEVEQRQLCKIRDACGVKSILWEDVMKKSENWSGFYGESLVIAMEIEQLILTDLVDEIVMTQPVSWGFAMADAVISLDKIKAFCASQIYDEQNWALNSKLLRAVGLFAGSIVLMRNFGDLMAI
ncbi:hypothetical protein QVD17_02274 [Tagetes erecta]|uniref:DUF4378 domain-containing protein n=1 Tax=Tagetes erecta TaxID=13708 RepID=A0AAD8L931_TARER|nr:hypothetical protein QVD17_02274 [Tagetes erecta]